MTRTWGDRSAGGGRCTCPGPSRLGTDADYPPCWNGNCDLSAAEETGARAQGAIGRGASRVPARVNWASHQNGWTSSPVQPCRWVGPYRLPSERESAGVCEGCPWSKLVRTYLLVVPRPSLKFSGPWPGQSAGSPTKIRKRAVWPFHRLQRTMPCASLRLTFPSIQRAMPCANLVAAVLLGL